MVEIPSSACEGCNWLENNSCMFPTACHKRKIEGTNITLGDAFENILAYHLRINLKNVK